MSDDAWCVGVWFDGAPSYRFSSEVFSSCHTKLWVLHSQQTVGRAYLHMVQSSRRGDGTVLENADAVQTRGQQSDEEEEQNDYSTVRNAS